MFPIKLMTAGALLFGIAVLGAAGEDKEAAKGKDDPERKLLLAARQRSERNLKELMLALWNYHTINDHFPPAAIYDKNDKPLLSWRVLLLPYLEEDDLFAQFHLDEPWDSKHNKPLLAKMPKQYAPPRSGRTKEKDPTFYQVFVGKGTLFEGAEGLSIADISDGTSNTFGIVEAGEAVPWTKPADLPYDDKKPVPKLGGLFDDGFHAVMADGWVRFFTPKLTQRTLRLAITRDDGQPLGPDF
jgi:hypothetical protein